MPVAPVRTGPCPGTSAPSPAIIVTCPTRTPGTSVMPSTGPVGSVPIATGERAPAGAAASAAATIAHANARRTEPFGAADQRPNPAPMFFILRRQAHFMAGQSNPGAIEGNLLAARQTL